VVLIFSIGGYAEDKRGHDGYERVIFMIPRIALKHWQEVHIIYETKFRVYLET
jgi:hypothetical protein